MGEAPLPPRAIHPVISVADLRPLALRSAVDPGVERTCAARSGAGWIRRNSRFRGSQLAQATIGLRTPVAVELPHVPDLANLVQIQLGGDQLVPVP